MYPLGILFGLGFDTASEVGLLAMTAGASAGDLPAGAVLSLPILFAAGMSAMDTTDGVLMTKAYDWAFVNPLRKIFYNITITSLSIVVALMIGAIELSQVAIRVLDLNGAFFDRVAALDFGILGYVIVAHLPRCVGRLGARVEVRPDRGALRASPSRPCARACPRRRVSHAQAFSLAAGRPRRDCAGWPSPPM